MRIFIASGNAHTATMPLPSLRWVRAGRSPVHGSNCQRGDLIAFDAAATHQGFGAYEEDGGKAGICPA